MSVCDNRSPNTLPGEMRLTDTVDPPVAARPSWAATALPAPCGTTIVAFSCGPGMF